VRTPIQLKGGRKKVLPGTEKGKEIIFDQHTCSSIIRKLGGKKTPDTYSRGKEKKRGELYRRGRKKRAL